MRISAHSNKPLMEIRLRLYSTDTNFVHYVCPFSNGYGVEEFDRNARACIEFQDSREIDALIDMLEQFKKANRAYIGEWREC